MGEADVMPTEHTWDLEQKSQLAAEIKDSAEKLVRDDATRGDMKIISRAVKELRYAFKVFKPYRRRRKITVFGSARTPPDHPTYLQTVELGRRLAEEGWMVVTGAGGGIMEAAHVGAGREMSMGLNIMLPFEQDANYVISDDEKLVHLKYFFTRKLLFVKEVHGIVLCPGGFGTLDEGFETLTLVQTGKRDLMPIVLLDQPGGTYWADWLEYIKKQLLENALISPEDLSLVKVTNDVEDAIDEVMRFYSVYNSMRYVRGQLVLRLHKEPSDDFVDRLNDEFQDLLEGGRIHKSKVHPLESDDEHLADLPRLALRFNRRSIGRLRQLVDLINNELGEDSE
jgi:uncharacterized protein (TIGR00730 family)